MGTIALMCGEGDQEPGPIEWRGRVGTGTLVNGEGEKEEGP